MKRLYSIFSLLIIISKFAMATTPASEPCPAPPPPTSDEEVNNFRLWGMVIKMPPVNAPSEKGQQVLHFNTRNKPIEGNPTALAYAQNEMINAKVFTSDADIMKYAAEEAAKLGNGFLLEFGTKLGKPANFMAALSPKNTVHTFDSLRGLPEDWREGFPKGTFGYLRNNTFPSLIANAELHKGMFDDSLPKFIEQHIKPSNRPIAFIHIDCELYSSTKTVLDFLKDYIKPGTLILFDEYFNFPRWEGYEYRAFQDFVKNNNIRYEYVAYNGLHEQVLVRII
ncbi:MAG: class I SAM-dependent methyltransferase [Alphaproteobacteria bacterium]|nr:class I SAM-dependent methyltransferase [Alphaproteobacteria bacterium]